MKKGSGMTVWITIALIAVTAGPGGFFGYRALTARTAVMPEAFESVQYQLEKGRGLANIRVGEDIYLGVGMITGKVLADGFSEDGFTGSVSIEMVNQKPGFRLHIDRIRLIEQTPAGDGRVFEPYRLYDDETMKGSSPGLQFAEGTHYFPVSWESGSGNDSLYFVFAELPAGLASADLVLTYHVQFPGKKYPVYYEDRLSASRKSYPAMPR